MQRFHQGEHGFVDGGIDHLAAAGALARVQRHQRAEGRERRGQRVTQRHAGPGRRPVGVAGDVPDAAHRLADGAEPGPRRVRPGLAEPGHPGDDQARVDLPEPVRAEAPALQRARPEVLQQHVGPFGEPADQILAAGIAQVDGDRLLVPRHHRPPQRHPVRLLPAPLPHRVALPGLLDLDDLRAEVAEQLAAERAGEQLAELGDPQVLQGRSSVWPRVGLVGHRHLVTLLRQGAPSLDCMQSIEISRVVARP